MKNSKRRKDAETTADWQRREAAGLVRMEQESEIGQWLAAGDDAVALTLMIKHLPSHWAEPGELKSVPLTTPFFAIRVLGVARSPCMNQIIECLHAGNNATAIQLMRKRLHISEESIDPYPKNLAQ